MNAIWSILVPSLLGLLSGAVGSLIAPWVNWGVEKRREKLKYRREVIHRCRERIDSPDFTKQSFRATLEFRYLKRFMSKDDIRNIEADTAFLVPQQDENSVLPYRRILHDAVERLEKDWDLI